MTDAPIRGRKTPQQYKLILEPGLRRRIDRAAKDADRSVADEIRYRLMISLSEHPVAPVSEFLRRLQNHIDSWYDPVSPGSRLICPECKEIISTKPGAMTKCGRDVCGLWRTVMHLAITGFLVGFVFMTAWAT